MMVIQISVSTTDAEEEVVEWYQTDYIILWEGTRSHLQQQTYGTTWKDHVQVPSQAKEENGKKLTGYHNVILNLYPQFSLKRNQESLWSVELHWEKSRKTAEWTHTYTDTLRVNVETDCQEQKKAGLNIKKSKLVAMGTAIRFRSDNKNVEVVGSFCFFDWLSTVKEQLVTKYPADY